MNYLAIAWRNIRYNYRRSIATILAIAVGLAAVNLFSGYIANVYAGLKEQAVKGERLGHLTVYKEGMLNEGKIKPRKYMFSAGEAAKLVAAIKEDPRVVLVTPRVSISGIFSNGSASTIFIGEGLVPEDLKALRGDLVADFGGKLEPSSKSGIAVSADLAKIMNLGMNDGAALLSPTLHGQANAMDGDIIDIFNTGNAGTNDKYIVVPFEFAQHLLDTDSVERYIVLLSDVGQTDVVRNDLQQRLKAAGFAVEIKTWEELSSFYTQVRNLFDMIFGFIFSIVFVVVVMSVVNTMGMTVIERTREIGTLRALGLQRRGTVALFAFEGCLIAIVGSVLGLLGTIAVTTAVNNAGITYTPPNSSGAVKLLVDLHPYSVASVLIFIVVMATAAALWPASRASRKEIVEALAHV
jgi:putative ABC transport system permease protein